LKKLDPERPNLRQVHLIPVELLDKLHEKGFSVNPGELGENITTKGVYLLGLPTGTKLKIGKHAVVELTGLRNPCKQIDQFQKGLQNALLFADEDGNLVNEAGVMGIVVVGGEIFPGDPILIDMPPKPHQPLVYTGELLY
jgi:MOSC domain-containing protein YiiM